MPMDRLRLMGRLSQILMGFKGCVEVLRKQAAAGTMPYKMLLHKYCAFHWMVE